MTLLFPLFFCCHALLSAFCDDAVECGVDERWALGCGIDLCDFDVFVEADVQGDVVKGEDFRQRGL